jgi:hypothetical protein
MAVFLFCLRTCSSLAQPQQAVVVERQGDRAVINKGQAEGVQVGQTWHLDKGGKLVIEAIREHSASGKLEGTGAVGALASLGKEKLVVASQPAISTQMNSRRQPTSESLDSLRKKYRRALSQRTRSEGFVTPIPGQYNQTFNTGLEAYNLYQLYDITNSMGLDPTGAFIQNPLILATAAAGMYQQNKMTNELYESVRVRVDVEATLWDEALVDLQTEVAAAEQGLSVQDTLTKKVQRISEMGVDKYVVLEVRLKNVGSTPAPMEPMKYRIFMMSHEGQPIAASRIDGVLDKTLQPGDEVRGMVYFPKIVAAGQGKLQIAFEQMFGDRGTLTFSNK